MLMALSSNEVDWESLLPDVWIAAHPEHFLTDRRDEAFAAAIARRRRRERRRAKAPEHSRSPCDGLGAGWGAHGPDRGTGDSVLNERWGSGRAH